MVLTTIRIRESQCVEKTKNRDLRGAGVPPAVLPFSAARKTAGGTPAPRKSGRAKFVMIMGGKF
jgi:hypothetical protein